MRYLNPRQLWLCRLPIPLASRLCPCSAPTAAKGSGHTFLRLPASAALVSSSREGKRRNPTQHSGTVSRRWWKEARLTEPLQLPQSSSAAAPFLLTPFPVGSMHYYFLFSHLQHPERKKDFSDCFADCRGHSLLPGGWSYAGKGQPIQARGSALLLC